MEFTNLVASAREKGKSNNRAIRLEGNVPCILYGHHVEPVPFKLESLNLRQLVRSQETPLVKIELDGNSWNCILKVVDYHPVTDDPIHADFQVLQEGEKITLSVPFHFKGTPVGQIAGGNTQFVLSEVEIVCLPKDIPAFFEVDVSHLKIGDSIHLSDLDIEGVEFSATNDQTVVIIHAPRLLVTAEDEEAEGLEEGEEGMEDGEGDGEDDGGEE